MEWFRRENELIALSINGIRWLVIIFPGNSFNILSLRY